MASLEATAFVREQDWPRNVLADVIVVEQNGDIVECRCKIGDFGSSDQTIDISGYEEPIAYLHRRYGDRHFCSTVVHAVLRALDVPSEGRIIPPAHS